MPRLQASSLFGPTGVIPSWLLQRRFLLLIVGKLILASISPLHYDFINLVLGGWNVWGSIEDGSFFVGHVPYTAQLYLTAIFYKLWLLLPVDHPLVSQVYGGYYVRQSLGLFALHTLMKLPMFIADLVTAILLYKLVLLISQSESKATVTAWVWIINPYNTLMHEMFATIDIVASSLVILSLYSLLKNRVTTSFASLAAATLLRLYPIILLPVYALWAYQRGRALLRLGTILSLGAILFMSTLPFMIRFGPEYFLQVVRVAFMSFHELKFPLGFSLTSSGRTGESVAIGLAATFYVIQLYLIKKYWNPDSRLALNAAFAMLLIFFAFSRHAAYWAPWITPLVILHYFVNPTSRLYPAIFFTAEAFWMISGWDITMYGSSLFFIPNYTREMQIVSSFLQASNYQNVFLFNLGSSVVSAVALFYLILVNMQNIVEKRHAS